MVGHIDFVSTKSAKKLIANFSFSALGDAVRIFTACLSQTKGQLLHGVWIFYAALVPDSYNS